MAGVLVAVAVAALLGVFVAGRGAASPLAAAARKAATAGGAHVSFALAIRSPKLANGATVRLDGSGTVGKSGAEIGVDLQPLRSTQQASRIPSSLRAILVRQDGHALAFLHLTPMPAFTGGKDWIELDLSTLASAHGIDLGALAGVGSTLTPAQVLDLLRGAGTTVIDLGEARVDGVSTTHYRLVVDAAEAAKAAGLPSALVGRLGSHAAAEVPVNVWIGRSDGLLRRVALVLRHGASEVSFSLSLRDYGADVSVAAPPSADVFDATALLSALGGAARH